MNSDDIVFLDETGIDNDEVPDKGWTEKGKRLYDLKPARGTERTTIIAALNGKKIFAPLLFEGYTNTNVFIVYLEKVLIPSLTKGQTVIMDNASFHTNSNIRKLIEDAGCYLKFLPSYSPDLNMIEHYWQPIKNKIRKKMAILKNDVFLSAQNVFAGIGSA